MSCAECLKHAITLHITKTNKTECKISQWILLCGVGEKEYLQIFGPDHQIWYFLQQTDVGTKSMQKQHQHMKSQDHLATSTQIH